MKKVFAILAIAGLMVACNNKSDKKTDGTDTTKAPDTAMVTTPDTAATTAPDTAAAKTDTTASKMQ